MHVILLAPHFPAGQRRFLRALKAVGAGVTGIVDAPLEAIDHEIRGDVRKLAKDSVTVTVPSAESL